MDATRLRKTFHYPFEDSDDDSTPGDLDEEEQEQLIEKLKKEEFKRNEFYKLIFTVLPIISALAFLPTFLTSPIYQARFLSLLCITSLSATAYIAYYIPNAQNDDPPKQALLLQPKPGPLDKHIAPFNIMLSVLLSLNAFIYKHRPEVGRAFWVLCLLPFTNISIVLLARRLMRSVDVGALERLRYGYKGA